MNGNCSLKSNDRGNAWISSKLTFLGIVDREFAEAETAPSIPWLAAIQGIKSKKDLAGLAPKGCFISAEAVEHVVGQIGESQKATRELGGGIDSHFDGFPDGAGHDALPCDAGSASKLPEVATSGPSKQGIDNLSRAWGNRQPGLAEFPLHGRLGIVIRNDGRLERFVIFGIL